MATKAFFQTGDAVRILKMLNSKEKYAGLFKAIITSPPYYRCRQYGENINEIGRESTIQEYLENLAFVFSLCKNVLSSDGTLWIVINDVRKSSSKQNIPHRLAHMLAHMGYIFLDDLIWSWLTKDRIYSNTLGTDGEAK